VSPVKYALRLYIPDDDILHTHCNFDIQLSTSGFITLQVIHIDGRSVKYPFYPKRTCDIVP
jgi:hypothetical protein